MKPAWTLRFGPSPAGVAWVVQCEDGTGPSMTCAPDAYEEARSMLVKRALADEVEAVELTILLEEGKPHVRRHVLDR